AVRGVERQREEAALVPLEASLALRRLDDGAAPTRQHVHDGLEEMTLRRRPTARRDLEHVHVREVAASMTECVGAERAATRPGRDVECEQVEAEALVDGDAFG